MTSVAPAEPGLGVAEFRAIADLLRARSGIALPDTKRQLVFSRLARRLRAVGLADFNAYVDLLRSPGGADEVIHMISALTTNVTAFFRESHHFDTLRKDVLPPLVDHARAGGRVRLWSAGCSSGEEPYSIAMVLLDLCPEAAGLDILVLATDIDPAILSRAREGQYDDDMLSGLNVRRRERWFDAEGRVRPELAAPIKFRELNLSEDWPVRGPFDAIFCRNVAIYFDRAGQDRVWSEFASRLSPGATLFIGHSERISGPATGLLRPVGITTYRRAG